LLYGAASLDSTAAAWTRRALAQPNSRGHLIRCRAVPRRGVVERVLGAQAPEAD
jgi:hypothetical protein